MAVSTSLLGAICIFVLATGAKGQSQDCLTKQQECTRLVSDLSLETAGLLQTSPINTSAILAQCSKVQSQVGACVDGIEQVCPASTQLSNTMKTIQDNVNSLCGPATTCAFRLHDCGMDMNTVTEISQAMGTMPPNVELIKHNCSALRAKSEPCLAALEAECNNVSNVATSISSLRTGLNSLCGQNALCQIQMAKCQAPFVNLSNTTGGTGGGNNVDIQKICKVYGEVKTCLDSEMEPVCRTLPEIKQVLDGAISSLSAYSCDGQGEGGITCPQAMACLQTMGESPGMAGSCSGAAEPIECLDKLKGTCELDESKVTFNELKPLYVETCQAVLAVNVSDCQAVGTCVMNSDLVKEFTSTEGQAPTVEQLKRLNQLLLSAETWCQYMTTVTQCNLESADSCNLDANGVKDIRQLHEKLKTTCGSTSNGMSLPMASYFLLLVPALVALWTSKLTS